jgi:hypothetical protein
MATGVELQNMKENEIDIRRVKRRYQSTAVHINQAFLELNTNRVNLVMVLVMYSFLK